MTAWILRVSESKANYWSTYAVDLSLMVFFLAWDASRMGVSPLWMTSLFVAGAFFWTPVEYAFHRWFYHDGFTLTRNGHEKHHADPTGTVAMPCFVTPLLFVPLQQLVANYFRASGFSSFLAGWFFGFIAYSFVHHSLHHWKLPFAWYRHLQSQHRIHHAIPDKNFGVTVRMWDRVFGTEFKKQAP